MAINYGANYIGIDKDRYDAGNKFYSQDPYLQGTGLNKPAITFNPSQSNTGIMSGYNPYPIIPQYSGGDGGGGPFGGIDKGVTADASAAGGYSLNPDGTAFNSPEVEEELAANRRAQTLKNVKNFGMFALNPMGFAMGKGLGYLKDKFFGGNDGDGGGDGPNIDPGTFTAESLSSSFDSEEGPTGGSTSTDQGETSSDSGFSDDQGEVTAAEGGRIGYNGGGVTNYKNFLVKKGYKDMMQGMSDNEIRGLYDSVMGTFSLRRAYGGIVGMYR